jgi:cephalosporin-C deacetylase
VTRDEPGDFDLFWKETVADARAHPLDPSYREVDCGLSGLKTVDVRFRGYGGQSVAAWLVLPRHRPVGSLPGVVQYVGYGAGRGLPTDHLLWASAGYAHLVMDTRGQGADTPDVEDPATEPTGGGFVARGVLSPRTWYYRRLFTDAVRAVEVARAHPAVDADRVAVAGVSQGGGIALAAAALDGGVAAALVDVPFPCGWSEAVHTARVGPYRELAEFCRERPDRAADAQRTVRYGDGVYFAARGSAAALFSVALEDEVCPPPTVRAAVAAYAGPARLVEYPFSAHEDASGARVRLHAREQVAFLRGLWG